MTESSVELLNMRLRRFLAYKLHWKYLNPIQEEAIPIILGGKDSLVIAPTASGKTEAVLLPVFSELLNNYFEPTSVIYVAPLKALINDMHNRIEYWGNYFDLKATKWHGDVSTSDRSKYINKPTDFLSITPESLEVILMNRNDKEKLRIFGNLRYVIIDEIHYFADSDRGTQLNSILNRISRYSQYDVQRIGLSATVGNPDAIQKWINHKEPAELIEDKSKRKSRYKIMSLFGNQLVTHFNRHTDKKILFFCRSRRNTELFYALFNNRSDMKNLFIHHSSLDKEIREEYEREFKEADAAFMFSTSTLELGIDIGNIDLVVQIEPTYSISSFLQRVGRSGRDPKKNVQQSIIIASRFDVLIALADLILAKEGKIEEIEISKSSKDLFFHQILSTVFSEGSISEKKVYKRLKNCYVFSEISFEDYQNLLDKMVELDFINKDSRGHLSLGFDFEMAFGRRNFMNFYSVFVPSYEYTIKEGKKLIGSLDVAFATMLEVGSQFILGGKPWKVVFIDKDDSLIRVEKEPSPDLDAPRWYADGAPLTYEISRKIYDILTVKFDDRFYKWLDPKSKDFLNYAIEKARENKFRKGIVPVHINKKSNTVRIYTFAGDKANNLLVKIFNMYYDTFREFSTPFYASFKTRQELDIQDVENIFYNIESILNDPETDEYLSELVGKFYKNKFINYLPEKDEIDLKMHLLFDKKNLVNLSKENSILEIQKDNFGEVILDENKYKRLENLEKSIIS